MSTAFAWQGIRTYGRLQALAWPRAGVVDREGYGIASNEIPTELKAAVAEIAFRELASPGTMTPDFTASTLAKREKVGDIEVEYAFGSMTADTIRPELTVVSDLVGQFMVSTASASSLVGTATR